MIYFIFSLNTDDFEEDKDNVDKRSYFYNYHGFEQAEDGIEDLHYGQLKKYEIKDVKMKLKKSRMSNWAERSNREELVNLLEKENVKLKEIVLGNEQNSSSIHILQIECNLTSEEILLHNAKLQLTDGLLSWGLANGKFTDIRSAFDWSCENEKEVLIESLIKQSEVHESPLYRLCTFRKTINKPIEQVMYHCHTCNLIGNNALCNACARICHDKHDISIKMDENRKLSCICGANKNGSCIALNLPQTSKECTFYFGKQQNRYQHIYECKTCYLVRICSRCIKNCHEDHEVLYVKYDSMDCVCECNYIFDDILSQCENSKAVEPLETWVYERFGKPQEAFDWSCENGKERLTEFFISHLDSFDWKRVYYRAEKFDSQFNRMCTILKTGIYEDNELKQIWYHCKTCEFVGDNTGVCNACAKYCHGDHDLSLPNLSNTFVCKCGAKKDESCKVVSLQKNKEICTLNMIENYQQHVYYCMTCFDKFKVQCENQNMSRFYICTRCVKICHKNHRVRYSYFTSLSCNCGSEKFGACKCLGSKDEGTDIVRIENLQEQACHAPPAEKDPDCMTVEQEDIAIAITSDQA